MIAVGRIISLYAVSQMNFLPNVCLYVVGGQAALGLGLVSNASRLSF